MLKADKGFTWLKWSGKTLFVMALLLRLTAASAMSAGQMIVDEAVDASDADTMRLDLKFIMPVQYLWHFPHASSDQFLISVQPITGLAKYDLKIREHIRIPPDMANIITDLYYDGTEASNRFIVLETNRDVDISVKAGKDGRSIVVEFNSIAPKPATDCKGTSKGGM